MSTVMQQRPICTSRQRLDPPSLSSENLRKGGTLGVTIPGNGLMRKLCAGSTGNRRASIAEDHSRKSQGQQVRPSSEKISAC